MNETSDVDLNSIFANAVHSVGERLSSKVVKLEEELEEVKLHRDMLSRNFNTCQEHLMKVQDKCDSLERRLIQQNNLYARLEKERDELKILLKDARKKLSFGQREIDAYVDKFAKEQDLHLAQLKMQEAKYDKLMAKKADLVLRLQKYEDV